MATWHQAAGARGQWGMVQRVQLLCSLPCSGLWPTLALVSAPCLRSAGLTLPLGRPDSAAPLLPPRQVTLIDQSERFSFKPLLYEVLSGAASEAEVRSWE